MPPLGFKCLSRLFGILFLSMGVTGCDPGLARKSTESDANGYLTKDGYKFYTDRNVFADKCPKTGDFEIMEVCAYAAEDWRPGDTNYVIAPRGQAVRAPDGRIFSRIFLPSAKQLEEWGAEYAARDKVKM